MGIALRLRLTGDGAMAWLPVAKAHLAAINARPNASFIRNLMNYPGVVIEVVRGTVIDQINITMLSGYLSVGWNGAAYRVLGSTEARGAFDDRAKSGTDWSGVLRSQVLYYGKGFGITAGTSLDAPGYGSTTDFDGNSLNAYTATLRATQDGRSSKPADEPFLFFGHYNSGGIMSAGWNLHTCWFKEGGVRTFMRGYSGLMVVGNQRGPFFICEIDGVRSYGATSFIPNQLASKPTSVMMGPGQFLMMSRYIRPDYVGSSVVVADCPGIAFSGSLDAGRTWVGTTAFASMFAAFDTVRTLLPPAISYGTTFNQAVEMADIQSVMLNGTTAFVVARVPYIEVGTLALKRKVTYGLGYPGSSFALTENGVLYDGDPGGEVATPYAIDGGVLLLTADSGVDYPLLTFTPDGITFEPIGTMPFIASRTGTIISIDKQTLLCPMYDEGEHRLYESKDRGATWTKRATIAKDGLNPDPAYPRLMQFGDVTLLQKDGAPAYQYPATPWAGDCNIEAPT